MKKIARTERKTNISFNKKNLDWSKFFCRQDLKVSLYVCLLEFILLLFVANYGAKILVFFFLDQRNAKQVFHLKCFCPKTKILR